MNKAHHYKVTLRKAQRLGRQLQELRRREKRAGIHPSLDWLDGVHKLRDLLFNAVRGFERLKI